jgi:hypothetical protein
MIGSEMQRDSFAFAKQSTCSISGDRSPALLENRHAGIVPFAKVLKKDSVIVRFMPLAQQK